MKKFVEILFSGLKSLSGFLLNVPSVLSKNIELTTYSTCALGVVAIVAFFVKIDNTSTTTKIPARTSLKVMLADSTIIRASVDSATNMFANGEKITLKVNYYGNAFVTDEAIKFIDSGCTKVTKVEVPAKAYKRSDTKYFVQAIILEGGKPAQQFAVR